MKKPMVTLQTKISFSQTLQRVLEFHLDEGATIVDPTPGKKHSWQYYLKEIKKPSLLPISNFNVVFIEDDITSFALTTGWANIAGPADAIFYDPPYIFGTSQEQDSRVHDYGNYNYFEEAVAEFFSIANKMFPSFLKDDGKLFIKYTDVFSLQDREYFFCANKWPSILSNFKVIDHYIIVHHHISPTAWQVKDRPCGIVNYTYLTVLKKRVQS